MILLQQNLSCQNLKDCNIREANFHKKTKPPHNFLIQIDACLQKKSLKRRTWQNLNKQEILDAKPIN